MISPIALFDFSHAINVAFHGSSPEQTGDIVIQQLAALRSSVGQDGRVILCLDSKPYRRTKLFDGYKAGRKSEPELANIWDRTLARVLAEGYAAARAPSEEADDVMATLARIYVAMGCTDVRLVTADKDIAQCVTPAVRWFVPQLGKRDEFEIRDEQWVRTKFGDVDWVKEKKTGPEPKDIALVLAIMGDTSDKIPGVKGIGIKGAVGLVNTYGTTAGMADGLVAEANACKMKGKELSAFWRNFAAGMAEIPKWLALTTLRTDVELERPADEYLERVEPQPLAKPTPPSPEFEPTEEDLDFPGAPPTAEELEEERLAMDAERQAMAAELPVGRPLVAEPMEDGPVRRARQAAEADRIMPLTPKQSEAEWRAKGKDPAGSQQTEPASPAATGAAAGNPLPKAGASENGSSASPAASVTAAQGAHDPSKMVIGKDPKADAVLGELAEKTRVSSGSASTTPAPSAPVAQAPTTYPGSPPAPSAAGAASHPSAATPQDAAPSISSPAQIVPANQGPQRGARNEAIAALPPPRWELQCQPKTVDGMMWLAERLLDSRFSAFGSVNGTFAIISFGRELGMGYMQSLMSFCDVKGKPFMWAHAMRGKVLASPVCEYLINTECTAEASTWIARRRGWPEGVKSEYRFTYAEAVSIGLTTGVNRENWTKNPRSMVDKTASSRLIRQVFADVLWGIHCPEEE